ncbi:uncharacterized protein [Montipora foliosa]|uniref:uncharacterized protein n=1 Tax=Montipora foliosa TaxID=591990 RepID=UPI0035F13901
MSGKLAKNKKIREGQRTHATKVLASMNEVLTEYDGSRSAKDKITQLSIALNEKLVTLKALDESILSAVDDGEIESEINASENFRAQIHEVLVKLQSCQVAHDEQENVQKQETHQEPKSSGNKSKLPKLTLNKFNGDPKRWQEWWDSFCVAVHDNSAISTVEKFTYLRSLLEGNAARATSGLQLTSANYSAALEVLRERFAQKQIIINSHMESLIKLKPVNVISDVKGIRAVLDRVEIQVRGLQSLGIDSAQYGALLIPIFLEKLPDELKLIVSRKHKDDWELISVLEAVKSEVEAQECSGIQSTTEKPPPRRPTFHTGSNNATASALLSGEGKFICLFCKGNHRASECHVVTNIEGRKSILKKQGRCFICLRRGGHLARNCDSNLQCVGCQGRHHLAVCDGRGVGDGDNSDSAVDGASNHPESPTSSMHVSSSMHVFLQTGIIERVDTTECPAVGPALTPTIFKILLRFRERKIALVGDIEKAFLNIKVQEQDRNVLRFLWIDSLEKYDPELVLYRFCRVVFGVNSSPFLLNATLRHHISQYSLDAEFVENLLNSFYVDDLVSGERNLERCLLLYEKSKKCLSAGGFNLRKWISNSPQLLELIREDRTRTKENCPETKPVVEETETYARVAVGHLEELDMKNEHKVLGLNWNCVSDEFIFKFEALLRLAESLEPTRRSLLKITSSFFDPQGILSPVLVQMKLLFQLLCQGNIAWGAPLPEPVRRQWKAWLQDLREVEQIMIPRCLYDGVEEVVTSYTLHGFGDASEKAYCAVVYLVLETSSGNYPVLLTSKTRVAPLAKQSIPRLELLSGVILARLASSVKEALQSQVQIDKTYLWLDSKTAIYWIKGSKEWKQFVQNRVNEILS